MIEFLLWKQCSGHWVRSSDQATYLRGHAPECWATEGGQWEQATGQHPSYHTNNEPSYTTWESAWGPRCHMEGIRRSQKTNVSNLKIPLRSWNPLCSFACLWWNKSVSNIVLCFNHMGHLAWEPHQSFPVLRHAQSNCCFRGPTCQATVPDVSVLRPRHADSQTPPSEGTEITQ